MEQEKGQQLVNFDYQNINSFCLRHHYVNRSYYFQVSSEFRNTISNQSVPIFTIQYPVPLFSLCTKSLIAVLKDAKQLSEENVGGPFC